MKTHARLNNFPTIIDPLDHYGDIPDERLVAACGFVLEWVGLTPADEPLIPALDEAYAHGGGWQEFNGFITHADGRLEYAGDPDQYPLIEVQHGEEIFRMYPHAWVSVTTKGETHTARMD